MPDNKTKNQKSKIKSVNQKSKVLASKSKTAEKKEVVKKAAVKKTVSKTAGVVASIYNIQGKGVSEIVLPKEIFGAKVNRALMTQAVRVYLANQRRGTVSTKTRGEVVGSTRKIWRQKGTGKARHGSRKAPIFVGGGVAFGPKPRDYSLKLPKKMKRLSLFSALSAKQNNGEIKIVAGLEKTEPKTKKMNLVMNNLGLGQKNRLVLLVAPGSSKNGLENIYRASRNLKGVKILSANMLNTYEVLKAKAVVLMKESVDSIKDSFLKEKN